FSLEHRAKHEFDPGPREARNKLLQITEYILITRRPLRPHSIALRQQVLVVEHPGEPGALCIGCGPDHVRDHEINREFFCNLHNAPSSFPAGVETFIET